MQIPKEKYKRSSCTFIITASKVDVIKVYGYSWVILRYVIISKKLSSALFR